MVAETGDTSKTAGDYAGRRRARRVGRVAARRHAQGRAPTAATVKAVVVGDQAHASFDNVAFLDKQTVLLTEDRGETLHQQANALDSLWSFDITKPLDKINADAKRLIAQGRDPEATGDIALKEPAPPTALTHNDGDNELTGHPRVRRLDLAVGHPRRRAARQRRRLEPVADVRHRPARGEHHLRDRRHQEARGTW